jgi:hypothetical protein
MGVALLLAAAHAGGNGRGDFSPLAVGNTWVYSLTVVGGGFWWNPSVSAHVRRTLRVESLAEAGGVSVHVLSFRDSLYARFRSPDHGSTASPQLPDTVRTGLFQVADSAGDGRLSLHPMGSPIPAGMEAFFRRRFRSGEIAIATAAGDSLHVVSVDARYNGTMNDSAVYARDLGLLYFRRRYDLLGEARIPGYINTLCRLESFNGKTVSSTDFLGTVSPDSLVPGFSGLRKGRSWRYRGLRQQVMEMVAGNHVRRDSIVREVIVIGMALSEGNPSYSLSLKDSLHHRTYDGLSRADSVEAKTISVSQAPGRTFFTADRGWGTPETVDDFAILFNWDALLAESLELRDFGGGPVRTSEYRESYPGLLEDTLIHAQGIGLIRRSHVLEGTYPGLFERIDWRLVELDGKPFAAVPVSTRAPAPGSPRKRASASVWRAWRLYDFLGRIPELR